MGRSHGSGGGRSHFSSGGGGRSHFSSSSRSSSSFHRGPSRHSGMHHRSYIGGPHIHTSIHLRGPAGGIVATIVLYIIFFVMPLIIAFSGVNQGIDEITTSYNYYQSMIAYAQQNPNYLKEGVVTGIYQDMKYEDAWYLKYTVYSPNSNSQIYVSDYTFSVYDSDDIEDIEYGDEIMIAVDNPNPPIFDSIDMNYANVELDDDPEYEEYTQKKKNLTKTFTIYGIIATAIAGLSLSIIIIPMVKRLKQKQSNDSVVASETPIQEKPKTRYCAYCGVVLDKDSDKCNVCGARNDKQ